jgi:probable F420-dependent oxidoreductase
MAKKAEEIGLHSFWVNDRLVYNNLDPLTVIMSAAAVTEQIKIGTSVILAALRQPVLLAKSLASIDFLSNGRLIAGIGLGGRKDDFDAVAIPLEGRGARLTEAIRLIRKLWSGENVDYSGKFYQVSGITIGPKPVQSPGPPIWLGGSAEGALRRAALYGDGYICGTSGLHRFRYIWEKICEYARGVNRDPTTIERAGLNFIAIDENKSRAVSVCENYLNAYYGRVYVDVESTMIVGPPGRCTERIQKIIESGIQTLILGLVIPDLRQLDLLSSKVLPVLRQA